jgi:hypothetical protein
MEVTKSKEPAQGAKGEQKPDLEWQTRPLEPMYPVVFFDALPVKIRDEGSVKNKAVYVALGIW